MKCKKCAGILFKIDIIPCCDDCRENGASTEQDYTHDEILIFKKSLTRNQVEDNGECAMGLAFGAGCYMFTCSACNHRKHVPLNDAC